MRHFFAYVLAFTIACLAAFAQEKIDLGTVVTVIRSSDTDATFSAQEIAESNAATLQDFLAKNNCLVMSTGGTGSMANVSIGGYAGFCIKVYVDGVLANNPATGEFDWNSIPLDTIESIKIQDIPSLGQEQFSGFVILIKTKSFSAKKITFSLANLSYESCPLDTQFLNFGLQDMIGKTAFKLALSATNAQNRYFNIDSTVHEDSRYGGASLYLSWSRYIGAHSVGGIHSVSYNRLCVPASLEPAGLQNTLFVANTISADFSLPFGFTQTKLTYNLDFLDYTEKTTAQGAAATENIFHSFTLQADHHFSAVDFSKGGRLEPTVSVKGGLVKAHINLDGKNNISNTKTALSPYRLTLYPSVAAELQTQFVKVEPIVGCLIIKDFVNGNETLHRNLNFAISATFAEVFTLSGATQNAFPTFNQLYWNYDAASDASVASGASAKEHGNPNLLPESGYTVKLRFQNNFSDGKGLTSKLSEWIPFSLSVAFSYYKNKIRWINDFYGNAEHKTLHPQNTSSAYYFDADFASANTFLFPKNFSLGYKAKTRFTRTFLLDERFYGNQIMWVPHVVANLSLETGYKKLLVSASYDYISKRYISNLNTTYYTPVHLLGIAVTFKCNANLSFVIEGKNLFDQRYLYHDGYSAPSRSYTAKVKAAF